MSASFIAVAFLAAVILVNWRLVLLGIAACLVALLAFGIGVVTSDVSGPTPSGVVHVGTAGPPAGDVGQPPAH